jgi:hypothetical protein
MYLQQGYVDGDVLRDVQRAGPDRLGVWGPLVWRRRHRLAKGCLGRGFGQLGAGPGLAVGRRLRQSIEFQFWDHYMGYEGRCQSTGRVSV